MAVSDHVFIFMKIFCMFHHCCLISLVINRLPDPNTFWGWGGEDDEMQKRCERLGINWEAPPKGTIRDLEDMNLQEKLSFLRGHKTWKCMVKWEALDEHEQTWKENGLKDLKYTMKSVVSLSDNNKASKLCCDIELNGNHWGNDKCGLDYMGE